MSRIELKRRRLPFRDFSLRSAQRRREMLMVGGRRLHEYVPLFINPRNPMFERQLAEFGRSVAYLLVSTEVLGKPGVHFSDGNVAYSEFGTQIYSHSEGVRKIPLEMIMSGVGNNRVRGAEVLVPEIVEPRYFLGVLVADDSVKAALPTLPNGIIPHTFRHLR